MRTTLMLAALWCASGCATALSDAPHLPLAALKDQSPRVMQQPFWLELHPGDTLPVELSVRGPLLSLAPSPPLVLRVEQPFFVLVGDGPPKLSYDGVHLASRSGSIMVGLGVSKAQRTVHGTVALTLGRQR